MFRSRMSLSAVGQRAVRGDFCARTLVRCNWTPKKTTAPPTNRRSFMNQATMDNVIIETLEVEANKNPHNAQKQYEVIKL